jgi:taurine--2-oxoglutarate transaminase
MDYPFFFTWTRQGTADHFNLIGGKGPVLLTDKKRKIFDLSSLSFQAAFGVNDPYISKKIKEQLGKITVTSPKAVYPLKVKATQRLLKFIEQTKKPTGKIFYTVSGAESVENAIKIARQVKNRKGILARKISYHGATLGALSITGDWRNEPHFTVDEWTVRIPEPKDDPTCKKTREIILKYGPENIAAFCLETITVGNGVIIPDQIWWDNIQKLCKEFDLFLILDEVACGFGRTGKPFGFHNWDLRPDLVTMAKVISGGMIPFGAVWVSSEISKKYDDEVFSFGLTNYAHPLGIAAQDAVLDHFNDKVFLNNNKKLIKVFNEKIKTIGKLNSVTGTRCIGLLAAVDLKVKVSWKMFFENGIYLFAKPKMIVICPAYCYTPKQLAEAMDKLILILKNLKE